MAPAFSGFPAEAMSFFRGLKRNNRREWFLPRKHIFEEKVKAPMIALVEAVNAAMVSFAPDYLTDPGTAIYRFYRDTRFSNDKTPYKDHIAAIFPRRGLRKHGCGCFYFSVSSQEIEVAGGVYMPDAEELRLLRSYLVEAHEEFRERINARPLRTLMGTLQGEQLSRVPKGFPAHHPAAGLVRYKQWYFLAELDPALATTSKLLPEIVKRFRVMTPFVEFLNAPLRQARRELAGKAFFL